MRGSGCNSPWLHFFIGHEEDSNPRRSDRRTRGPSTPFPKTRSANCATAGAATPSGATILEVKADQRAAAGWKPDGPAAMRVVERAHWLPPFVFVRRRDSRAISSPAWQSSDAPVL